MPELLIPGKKPTGPVTIDWSSPLARGLVANWLFNDRSNIVRDLANGPAGNLDVTGLEWKPNGLFFDNTNNASGVVGIDSPDPGFWHDAVSEIAVHAIFTLELDANGPAILFDFGGASNGFTIAYRTSPNQMCFAVASSGTTEIRSTTTFTPYSKIDLWAIYKNGSMELWINGVLEATGTRNVFIGANSDDPGIGSVGGEAVIGGDEWGGDIELLQIYGSVSTSVIIELYKNPYAFLIPA